MICLNCFRVTNPLGSLGPGFRYHREHKTAPMVATAVAATATAVDDGDEEVCIFEVQIVKFKLGITIMSP